MVSLGVLVSGGGSNLQSIIDQIEAGHLDALIKVVVSNEPDAGGLDRAKKHGLPTAVVSHRDFTSRDLFDQALIGVLNQHDVELVILAGFMRILSGSFMRTFPNRIMNIHPALLPSFLEPMFGRIRLTMASRWPVVPCILWTRAWTLAPSSSRPWSRSWKTIQPILFLRAY